MDMNVLSWIAIVVQGAIVGCLEYTEVSHNCWPDAGYCITLFENDEGIPWNQAKQHCEDNGDILLEIKSPSVQQHAASLTRELDVSQTAWIGGSRLTDNTLRSLDAQLQLDNFTSVEEVQNEELNCVFAVMVSSKIRYVLDSCDEQDANHSVICKNDYSSPASNMTCLEIVSLSDICYVIVNNNQSPDWFSAHNLCRWDLPGFVLFDDTDVDVMTSVLSHVGGTIWTGYFRKPWVWSNHEVLTYFNWAPGYADSGTRECMTIDKDGMWRHTGCQELRTHHMCATKDVREDGTGSSPAGASTQSVQVPGEKDLVPVYTGSAVGAVVFVVLVILVSVFVTRMRKLKSNDDRDGQRNAYVNTSADVTHETTYENELVSNQNHQYNSLVNRPAALITDQDSQHTSLRNQPDVFVTNQDSQYSSLENQTDHAGCAQDTAYEGICGTFDPALSQRVPDCGSPYAEVTIRK